MADNANHPVTSTSPTTPPVGKMSDVELFRHMLKHLKGATSPERFRTSIFVGSNMVLETCVANAHGAVMHDILQEVINRANKLPG